MAHLSSGRVNLAQMREGIRRQLLKCLDKCPGSKVSFRNYFHNCSTQPGLQFLKYTSKIN